MFWLYSNNTSSVKVHIHPGHEHELTFTYRDTTHLLYFTEDRCTSDSIISN
jgi:hypothetical protein